MIETPEQARACKPDLDDAIRASHVWLVSAAALAPPEGDDYPTFEALYEATGCNVIDWIDTEDDLTVAVYAEVVSPSARAALEAHGRRPAAVSVTADDEDEAAEWPEDEVIYTHQLTWRLAVTARATEAA